MRRNYHFRNSIAFVLLAVFFCCALVLIVSMLKVPDINAGNGAVSAYNNNMKLLKASGNDNSIGTLGNMMIDMLPEDLAFTVFVPSETAFERDLRLNAKDSLVGEKTNDTYSVISRLLGFSAVPRVLDLSTVSAGHKEVSYDSLSGFELFISKDYYGVLVVNGVKSERVDIRRGKHVVHVMDGVLMDAEFRQAVQPDFNGVKSERVDIRRGKHVVHVMDGVLMDAEFRQAVQPDFDGDD